MANELVRKGGGAIAKSGGTEIAHSKKSALKHAAKKHAVKKHAAKKHAEKHVEKHAAKKHAKKATKHVESQEGAGLVLKELMGDKALRRAFHHLQRASVVISLVERENGGDLGELLEFGVALYKHAVEADGRHGTEDAALGVLKAAEHLAMAALYASRKDHAKKVPPSAGKESKRLKKVGRRLEETSSEQKGDWTRVRSMGLELVRRAEAAGDDSHLSWEIRMAAEGLCDALEAGGD